MTLEELYRYAIDHGCEPSQTRIELMVRTEVGTEPIELEPSKIEINAIVTDGRDLLTIETW